MITIRINNNLAGALRTAHQLGRTADCEVSPRRSGEVICRLPCTLEGRRRARRAFTAGTDGVVWFDDRCPADLKGVRRRRKGGRHGAWA